MRPPPFTLFMKKLKKPITIVVGINTLTQVDQLAYSNHCQLWFRLGRNTKYEFILNNPRRMSIDHMRNMTAKIAVDRNADYLLFIDDDVLVPFDAVQRLIAADADIAAGWTLIRGYPFENMFFKYRKNDPTALEKYENPKINKDGLIDCDAVGFSCCLIKVSLLKKVETPYFVTGPHNTEDVYFCLKAKQAYPETRIVVDSKIQTAHILGAEIIEPANRVAYKKYFETMNPTIKKDSKKPQEPISIPKMREGDLSYEEVLKRAVFKGGKIVKRVVK